MRAYLRDFDLSCNGYFLDEKELPNIKDIFWRNNIVGFAPLLSADVKAEIFSDKIWLIAGVIVYLTVSIIEISCLITVKEDAED